METGSLGLPSGVPKSQPEFTQPSGEDNFSWWQVPPPGQAQEVASARLLCTQLACFLHFSHWGLCQGEQNTRPRAGGALLLSYSPLITNSGFAPPPPPFGECYEWNVQIPACELGARNAGPGDLPTQGCPSALQPGIGELVAALMVCNRHLRD